MISQSMIVRCIQQPFSYGASRRRDGAKIRQRGTNGESTEGMMANDANRAHQAAVKRAHGVKNPLLDWLLSAACTASLSQGREISVSRKRAIMRKFPKSACIGHAFSIF
jgi:hypothetical protein